MADFFPFFRFETLKIKILLPSDLPETLDDECRCMCKQNNAMPKMMLSKHEGFSQTDKPLYFTIKAIIEEQI